MPKDFPTTTIAKRSAAYPDLLKQIHDAPKQLYCRGNLDLLGSECVGVVGTRMLTPYGREVAQTIVRELAAHFVIVSGLALGIDAVAHQAALDAGGATIAVLGSGIDDDAIAPRTNLSLAREILARGGLVISEYPEGSQAQPFTFPARNRIISGLSRGVLVVEADAKSGALITAKLALEQDRDVFAVPGGIFSAKSIGPNLLIQEGAKLTLSARDIIQEYVADADRKAGLGRRVSTQDPLEEKILGILGSSGPLFLDVIIRACDEPAHRVTAALAMLEIRGMVRNIGNGTYRTTNA